MSIFFSSSSQSDLKANIVEPPSKVVLAKLPFALLRANNFGSFMTKTTGNLRAGKSKNKYLKNDGISWSISSQGMPKSAIPRGVSNETFKFSQTVNSISTLFSTSAAVPTFGGYSFVFSDIAQSSALSGVFDQYRVDLLEMWIEPYVTQTNGVSSKYTSVIDYDDDTVLASYGSAGDYENAVESYLGDGQYRVFKPHMAYGLYSGAVFTSFGNKEADWIDMASLGVRHYGVKIAAETSAAVVAIKYTVRAHISCRNIR